MYNSIAVYFYKSSSSEKTNSFFSFLFLVQMKTRGRSGALRQLTLARLTSNWGFVSADMRQQQCKKKKRKPPRFNNKV